MATLRVTLKVEVIDSLGSNSLEQAVTQTSGNPRFHSTETAAALEVLASKTFRQLEAVYGTTATS